MDENTRLSLRQICFNARFLNLLILIIAMLILGPLLGEFVRLRMLMDMFWSAVFIAAIYAVSQKKYHLIAAILLVVPMLASIWSRYLVQFKPLEVVGGLCGAAFFIYMIIQILIYIYKQEEVTRDLIAGAAAVYLMMALAWTFIFSVLEYVDPGSFAFPEINRTQPGRSFLYFSFVTLTTLGYGDITPVSNLARALCTLEAVLGQLYLVVQVAWLVGIHVSQSILKRSR